MKINKNLIQKHIKSITPDQIEFLELGGDDCVQLKIYTLDSILLATIHLDCSLYKIEQIQSKYEEDASRVVLTKTLCEVATLPDTVFVDILCSVGDKLRIYKNMCNAEFINDLMSLQNELAIKAN